MKIEQFFQDYAIHYVTGDERHRHARQGWVHIECPFCVGNPGYHLGYNLQDDYFNCWRCGGHSQVNVVANLLQINKHEAYRIVNKYSGGIRVKEKPTNKLPYAVPSNIQPLLSAHRSYLQSREFDPDYLAAAFDVQSCGVMSRMDGINFQHRLFIPIQWMGAEVSFQTRAVGQTSLRYITCPEKREKIHHKHILYGRTGLWRDTIILTEGVTDVWRVGKYGAATFGIKYTPKQLRLIAKLFKRVALLYDSDPQAQQQANKLVGELKFRSVDAFKIDIQGDPADIKQAEIDYIVKQII